MNRNRDDSILFSSGVCVLTVILVAALRIDAFKSHVRSGRHSPPDQNSEELKANDTRSGR
jgi:hypothetical protein